MANRSLTFKLGLAATPALLLVAGWCSWRLLDDPAGSKEGDPARQAAEEIAGESPAPGGAPLELTSDVRALAVKAPEGSTDLGSGEHSIAGTVLAPSGEPAPGAVVILIALGDDREPGPDAAREIGKLLALGPRVAAAAGGAFRFAGVGPGRFRLAARREGDLPAMSGVTALGGELESPPVELRLRAAASLRGIVSGPDGSPVENALVRS